ncbi:hypothetical protein ACMTAU_16435, partial [Alcaligenes pakistanensis]
LLHLCRAFTEFSLKSGRSMLKFQASSDTWQKVFRHYSTWQDLKNPNPVKKTALLLFSAGIYKA